MQNINQYSVVIEIDFDAVSQDYPYNKEYMYDEAKENGYPPPSISEICRRCLYDWLQEEITDYKPIELPFWDQVCKDFETWIVERGLE